MFHQEYEDGDYSARAVKAWWELVTEGGCQEEIWAKAIGLEEEAWSSK